MWVNEKRVKRSEIFIDDEKDVGVLSGGHLSQFQKNL